ncbi:hypothetical protein RDABS01_035265 [Bienertia sinuspersici]
MKLNMLCFADDLMLFCKGDIRSIKSLVKGLNHFERASGLKASNTKSEVFTANMKEEEVKSICERTGFRKGVWPFNYLGVPVCNRKLSRDECEVLVHKLTARVRNWQSRHISYVGRLQLVNAILLSICNYWMQVFILPAGVLKEVNRICRRFLWEGHMNGQKPGYVAWEKVCNSKTEGGLGIKDIALWNTIAVAKFVWQIAEKKDSLWVKWVHSVYIKEKNLWEYKPSVLASWVWRSICTIKRRLTSMDTADWWPPSGQGFKIGKIYHKIKSRGNKENRVKWASMVWNRTSIPKHCFIWWLAVQKRLMVKRRLFKYGVSSDPWCALCGTHEESHDHLFFRCQFSKRVWEDVFTWLQVRGKWSNMSELVHWCRRRCRTSKVRSQAIIAACASVIYSIWQARNQAHWERRRQQPEAYVSQVKFFVAKRCYRLSCKNCNSKDKGWIAEVCK